MCIYSKQEKSKGGSGATKGCVNNRKLLRRIVRGIFFLHTRSPAIFNVSASVTQHLQYSRGLRHNHKKIPRSLPATGGIKCTLIEPKNNVGKPGLLSDNGHDTPNDHDGARDKHKERYAMVSNGIDSVQSTGFIYNDSFGDLRLLTEISKGVQNGYYNGIRRF